MRLEHANLSVHDAKAMTRFLQMVSPDFCVRGEGRDAHNRPWRHVGNDDFYVALQTVTEGNDWEFVEYLSDDPQTRNDYADIET